MKLTMLGTGDALATKCFNTCFLLRASGQSFLVDGGGGNGILRQLSRAGTGWEAVREIFVTHKHLDHLLGIFWMLRLVCQHMASGEYEGEARIYAHDEVVEILGRAAKALLSKREASFVGGRLRLVAVNDGEHKTILGHDVTFFDVRSTKAKQFGFKMELGSGETLTCAGDEPLNPATEKFAEGGKWLLHEAFCLHSEAELFRPYEKHHSTVKDACETAERLGVKNLLLYHTEDKNLARRKELYTAEGRKYFSGNLLVPDDLESFEL